MCGGFPPYVGMSSAENISNCTVEDIIKVRFQDERSVILSEAKNPVIFLLHLTGFFGASHLRMTKNVTF